ncbi:hypothetical protein RvY_10193 [Ramazzottius varieornatus]|uniref:Protein-L-isoaspartate O-methyltransferase domain-containing protein 1 n=1 Tax=Ramazzottius varieornatus TaxID=947166 RepID=A0A1D1VJQ9_RAMVA|nr:hypothetical protein RvY_10193 [Ramazzottius varieornatus]
MGGAVSSGRDNDDLIDNLVEGNFIKTEALQRVFRCVDRALYYLPEERAQAYRDQAWRYGTLHLSAPCIYAEVLGNLGLQPGMSFLNIGSGTGYLSTLAGLIVGLYGENHGVEIHESNVKYSMERLQHFLKESVALRYYDFAQPKFMVGNGLALGPEFHGRYDRIYVGAACDDEECIKKFSEMLKIGGAMIIPTEHSLVKVERTSATATATTNLMQCSFASLIQPQPSALSECVPPLNSPPKLKYICRSVIVRSMRNSVFSESAVYSDHPLWMPRTTKKHAEASSRRRLHRVVFPLLLAQEDGEDEPRIVLGNPINTNDNGNDAPAAHELQQPGSSQSAEVAGRSQSTGSEESEVEQAGQGLGSLEIEVTGDADTDEDLELPDYIEGGYGQGMDIDDPAQIARDEAIMADPVGRFKNGNYDFSPEVRARMRKRRLSTRTASESQPANSTDPKRRTSTGQTSTSSQALPSTSERPIELAARRVAERVGNLSGYMMSAEIDAGSETSSSSVQGGTSERAILTRPLGEDRVGVERVSTVVEDPEVDAVPDPNSADSTLPSALAMDVRMVEAVQSLPLPKSFQRFINFDRPLEEDLC